MAEITPKIGILSTGDELTNGNVLNTNSFQIAEILFDQFIQPGRHLTVSDEQAEIEQGIRFLLSSHSALIISGGLGPTSDDRTRFALSTVIGQELAFDEMSWQHIVARLNRLSLPIPDSNRQQCLFPVGADIYLNDHGTAPGCRVTFGNQQIFMLPGPPHECMPLLIQKVLPFLLNNHYAQPLFRYQWLLLDVSEGSIAALLDPLMANSNCQIGYRINQPYLQVKIQSADPQALEKLRVQFSALIEEKSISHQQEKASYQLGKYILENKRYCHIDDQMTGGLLATTLLTPETFDYLNFGSQCPQSPDIKIALSGLENYWQNRPKTSSITILITIDGKKIIKIQKDIPFRQQRTVISAMEIACWQILSVLFKSN